MLSLSAQTFNQTEDVLSKVGSSGTEVRNIQTRLKNWGYYTGSVDGQYGQLTKAAVIKFQKKNNLTADGIAGPKTLAAIGLPTGSSSGSSGGGSSGSGGYSSSDVDMLARMISGEARGEPYTGQVAVGAVILNRVEHPSFPNSISGVLYQNGAFDALKDGQFHSAATDSAKKAAKDALNGWDPSNGAIYYYNPSTATNKWIWSRPIIARIGKHNFCS
ncbi:MAG: spore cortex-lytic enzyme [Oscillospiraceae bacterium]|nr:spore cortex-lytic enzyme [Oscillospiraceae bacterium]